MNAFMVLEELRSGKLITIPGINLGVGGQFGVVRLRRRTLSVAAQRFIELLFERDAELALEEESYLGK